MLRGLRACGVSLVYALRHPREVGMKQMVAI